jgi:pyrroloquinoline-quinone synthase
MQTNWHLPDERGGQLTETELGVLNELLDSFAEHPGFHHEIWDWLAEGTYDLGQLQTFASLYYAHVRHFRKYLAGAITVSTIEATQVALADIVAEEYGCRYNVELQANGPSHPELYRRFMRSVGVQPEDWESVAPIAGIEHFRQVHYTMFQNGEQLPMLGAVMFGMESSTPFRHHRVTTGLEVFAAENNMNIDHTFFSRHVEVDPRHGQSLLMTVRTWLDSPVSVELLREGAIRSFDARKVFLDEVLERSRG